jgi:GxxExxY protein
MDENELSNEIIGAAIEVHRQIGPGLLETVYRDCLFLELKDRGISSVCEVPLALRYKEHEFPVAFRLDMLVEESVVVELKAVEKLAPVHTAQLLSYLKLSGRKLGLLMNFNVPVLRDGIKRVVNKL